MALREHGAQDLLDQRLVMHLLREIVVPVNAGEIRADHFEPFELVELVGLRQKLHGPVLVSLLLVRTSRAPL